MIQIAVTTQRWPHKGNPNGLITVKYAYQIFKSIGDACVFFQVFSCFSILIFDRSFLINKILLSRNIFKVFQKQKFLFIIRKAHNQFLIQNQQTLSRNFIQISGHLTNVDINKSLCKHDLDSSNHPKVASQGQPKWFDNCKICLPDYYLIHSR